MKIRVRVKQTGRKHALIENKVIEIDEIGTKPTFYELLKAIVKQQAAEYNSKTPEENLLPFLANDEISQQAVSGKVGFGSIYSEKKTDIAKGQKNAFQAFEDGIFAVFADDNEIKKLDEIISLDQVTVFTFIRLNFLAGSYW